jgi:DNA-binding MarR family transcriptional regulator
MEACLRDPLAELPGYALRRAANAMMAELSTRLAKIDLRISDASVLLILNGAESLTSSDIGRTLDIQRANMVPLLNRLDAAGLIERRPLDRKSVAIVLSAAGEAKLHEVRKITATFEDELLQRVPAEHRDHLVPALNALWR